MSSWWVGFVMGVVVGVAGTGLISFARFKSLHDRLDKLAASIESKVHG